MLLLKKPKLNNYHNRQQQKKNRESKFAISTGNAADIDTEQPGQKTKGQKNSGNNGEDIHLVVHLFGQPVDQFFLGYCCPVPGFVKVFQITGQLGRKITPEAMACRRKLASWERSRWLSDVNT